MSLSIPYGELEQKYEELKEAVERVRELHKPSSGTMRSDTYCVACIDLYPCRTIEALGE